MGDSSIGKERYEVLCEGKTAVLDNWRVLEITARGKTNTSRALKGNKGHTEELRAFFDACRTGSLSPIPWSSIERTTRATFAIEHACAAGATVEL